MSFTPASAFIPFSPPQIGPEEEHELLEALRSGWITTGPRVRAFEAATAAMAGATHGVATFSCTDAMLVALAAFGVGPGDEVITTPYTFISTAQVILHRGARPVFADVDPRTFNIDPARIEAAITPRTKGIMPVHFAGQVCDMDAILAIARRHGLFVIEDAAHAFGATHNGHPVGTLGDVACFSFYATKNITTAEGGMAVTSDADLAQRMRVLSMYGISDAREIWQKRYTRASNIHYDVQELGYKCNMTDLCAALGLVQLRRMDAIAAARRSYAAIYDEAFADLPVTTPHVAPYAGHAWHLYPLLLDLDRISLSRDEVVLRLKECNVGTSVMFTPLHLFSYFQREMGFNEGDFPVAEDLFSRVVCLPMSPALGEERIRKVAETVAHVVTEGAR